jgi:hypothetical protein
VTEVEDERGFAVSLIPETLNARRWAGRTGRAVNLDDLMANTWQLVARR